MSSRDFIISLILFIKKKRYILMILSIIPFLLLLCILDMTEYKINKYFILNNLKTLDLIAGASLLRLLLVSGVQLCLAVDLPPCSFVTTA